MFQVPRNRKFYKERKDNTITREDDGKLFHFRNKSVQWIADFLGNDDEETRGGALSSVMKIKILLRYVADPGIKNKIIHEWQAITCQVTSICFRQEDFFINTKTSNC
jgi:hypothetical protein